MKKTICKREYDTAVSEQIKKFTSGQFGDPAGFEETLYRTPEGLYFVYVCGGETSPYPNEDILRLARAKVDGWLQTH